MSILREWLRRLRGTLLGNPPETDMVDELKLHQEMMAEDLERQGLSPRDAMRQARLRVGSITHAMDLRRDQRGLPWLQDLLQDLRFGARTFRREPLFTGIALVTLTLAIGANTAIFSLIDPLAFRDLPVRDPAGLVQFTWRYPGDPPQNVFSLANYAHYRERNTVFSELIGVAPLFSEPRTSGRPATAAVVTGNFFEALGVGTVLGRRIQPADDNDGAAPVAVVSWRHWKQSFSGDERVLGTIIEVHDSRIPLPLRALVVGVASPSFTGVAAGVQPDVWLSLASVPGDVGSRGGLALMGRLKPGRSIDQARAEMRLLDRSRIESLAQQDPQWRHVTLDVLPARTGLATPLRDQFGGPLLMLMGLVAALLLLACANIGGLLVARGTARAREMAVRASLGASRFRIVRQLLAESLLLSIAGTAIGIMAALPAAGVLLRIITSGTRSIAAPPQLELHLDARVLLFAITAMLAATVLFGLGPAVAAFVRAPGRDLRESAAGPTRSRRLSGNALVAIQLALSLAFASVFGVYLDHLLHLRDRSLGFDREGVLLVSVQVPRQGRTREQTAALYREAISRLESISGVQSAAASGMTPISGGAASRFVRVQGHDEPAAVKKRVSLNNVTPHYFATYRTPLLSGRDFEESDARQPRRAIVNKAMASRYFAGRDPIGGRLWLDDEKEPYEIVGLVADAKYNDVRAAPPETVYLFYGTSGPSKFSVRTSLPQEAIAAEVRHVLEATFGTASVRQVTTLDAQVDAAIVPERLLAVVSGFFGTTGALLAAVGLYGLLGYNVTRRTREIGIRMALGATRADVTRLVVRHALVLVMAGLVIGTPIAWWGRRVAAASVANVNPPGTSPIVMGIIAVASVALLAAYVPVRRATRVDPVIALRTE